MALFTVPYVTSWRDAKGWVGRLRTFITSDDAVVTFRADIAVLALNIQASVVAITNCSFQGSNGLDDIGVQGLIYGTNAEYPAEWMKAVMQFSTPDGSISRFKIPAPKISIMEADGVTVINDGTNTHVNDYVSAMKGTQNGSFVSTREGIAFAHFEGGLVKFGKQPRRFNERVKSSHLVAGEGE